MMQTLPKGIATPNIRAHTPDAIPKFDGVLSSNATPT
jgi:hypothetical protein